jgi:hypothetical protein
MEMTGALRALEWMERMRRHPIQHRQRRQLG